LAVPRHGRPVARRLGAAGQDPDPSGQVGHGRLAADLEAGAGQVVPQTTTAPRAAGRERDELSLHMSPEAAAI